MSLQSVTKFAGAASQDTSRGSVGWTNFSNISADDGSRVENTEGIVNGSGSFWLTTSTFGFSIPAGETVQGIVAELEAKDEFIAVQNMVDGGVRTIKGGTIGSTDRSKPNDQIYPGNYQVRTYGGQTDKWGETWTPSDINASNFGLAFAVDVLPIGGSALAFVDYIKLTVYYGEIEGSMFMGANF